MASMRDIKLKIKSIKNTQQITKAMNLVSAAKLQRARQKLDVTAPFSAAMQGMMGNIVNSAGKDVSHRYFRERNVNMATTIVIAADRGLCGGYNVNICKLAHGDIPDRPNRNFMTVGLRARDFLKRRRCDVIDTVTGITEAPAYEDALAIGEKIFSMFDKKETDEVWLAYTHFKSIISHEPKMVRLLPVNIEDFRKPDEKADEKINEKANVKDDEKAAHHAQRSVMRIDPSEDEVLDMLIPKYINTVIYWALVEAAACQEGARMTAMDSATDNAQEMIEKYTVGYNRARQGAITQEITEIVSGANALE
jgi:F-type H+-transporting ATPase subunit gamma